MTTFTLDDLSKRVATDIAGAIEQHDVAAARAVSYAVTSSMDHMSGAAQAALTIIAQQIGRLLATTVPESAGDPELWRTIAAIALQMEARALGLDYSLDADDKTLTPD